MKQPKPNKTFRVEDDLMVILHNNTKQSQLPIEHGLSLGDGTVTPFKLSLRGTKA